MILSFSLVNIHITDICRIMLLCCSIVMSLLCTRPTYIEVALIQEQSIDTDLSSMKESLDLWRLG